MFPLYFDVLKVLVIFHFSFYGGTLVLIASFPGHCLPFFLFIFFKLKAAPKLIVINRRKTTELPHWNVYELTTGVNIFNGYNLTLGFSGSSNHFLSFSGRIMNL